VTVVGTLADLTPGEAIVAHGWWRNDTRHGWQFRAKDYRTALPATLQGMKKHLGSGLVEGIGPVNAGRTPLYTALTPARQLVVLVDQKKAQFLAARDWRRTPRHTALSGLLDGKLRFGRTRPTARSEDPTNDVGMALWEGGTENMP